MSVGLLTTVLNAKYLSVNDYADLVVAFLFVTIYDIANNIGIKEYIKSKSFNGEEINDIYCVEVLKGILVTVSALFFIGNFIDVNYNLKSCLIIISFSPLIFSIKNLKIFEVNREINFVPLNVIEVTSSLIGAAVMIYMLTNDWGIFSFAYSHLIRNISFTIFSHCYKPTKFKLIYRKSVLKKIARFSSWIVLTNLVFLFSSRLDQIIVINKFNATDIANYGFAYKILDSTLIQPMKIFTSMSSPLFLDKEKQRYIYPLYISQLMLIITITLFSCFIIPILLNIVIPGKWDMSYQFLPYLFTAGAFLSARNNGIFWYSMNTKISFKIEIVRAVSFLLIFLILSEIFGIKIIVLILSLIICSFITYTYWALSVFKIEENKLPKITLILYSILPIVFLLIVTNNGIFNI